VASESIEVSSGLAGTERRPPALVAAGLYEMPLYQRYINSTLNLVPGMSSGGFAYGGDLGSYHLAGQRSGAIGIFEDGVNGNDSGRHGATAAADSPAEVKVLTTVPPAGTRRRRDQQPRRVHERFTAASCGRTRSMRTHSSQHAFAAYAWVADGVPVFFMQPDANVGGPMKNRTSFSSAINVCMRRRWRR
jgi:hypothetical protein